MARNSKRPAHKRYSPSAYARILQAKHGDRAAQVADNRASRADMNGNVETATFYEEVTSVLMNPSRAS